MVLVMHEIFATGLISLNPRLSNRWYFIYMYKYSEYFNIMLNLINLKENDCNLYLYYTSLYFDIFLAQGKINTPVHGNKFYLEGYIP